MLTSEFFAAGGPLAGLLPGYSPRAGQVRMAAAVERAIFARRHLLVEAPTGTGKSLAYLVPAILHAVTERKKVVVATANIALQEQLISKDLPLVQRALEQAGIKFSFVLAKGLNNYLCPKEAEQARAAGSDCVSGDDVPRYRELVEWMDETKTGDVSELGFELKGKLRSLFTTTTDNCTGRTCPHYFECPGQRAKNGRETADVIVTNYHLFFADLVLRESTDDTSKVLPDRDVVIFDEAHKTGDVARDFFGFRVSRWSVRAAVRLLRETKLKDEVISLADELFGRKLPYLKKQRDFSVRIRRPIELESADKLVKLLQAAADQYRLEAKTVEGNDLKQKLFKLSSSCVTVSHRIRAALAAHDPARVFFIGDDGALECRLIDPADELRDALFEREKKRWTCILTSATLCVGSGSRAFDHLRAELGIDDAEQLEVESPFDWSRCLAVVDDRMPDPRAESYTTKATKIIREVVEEAGGRTLCLFTSYRMLEAARLALEPLEGRYAILKQGDAPRTELVRRFKEDVTSVLLGTESFWAGVDVPGESLSCVVMDRLPFVSPGDPVADAVSSRDDRWFFTWALPRAVVQFKQGFGRLIRSVDDRGVFVCLDRRLIDKSYKTTFLRSLPRGVRFTKDGSVVGRELARAA